MGFKCKGMVLGTVGWRLWWLVIKGVVEGWGSTGGSAGWFLVCGCGLVENRVLSYGVEDGFRVRAFGFRVVVGTMGFDFRYQRTTI